MNLKEYRIAAKKLTPAKAAPKAGESLFDRVIVAAGKTTARTRAFPTLVAEVHKVELANLLG